MLRWYYSFSSLENRKEIAIISQLAALPILDTLHYEDWQCLNGIIRSAALRIEKRFLMIVDSQHCRSWARLPEVKPMNNQPPIHRTVVVGLVRNSLGELLICRMKDDRGVFPGQWGFPGGGIEPGEQMLEALRREMREELGIEISHIRPAFFKDGSYEKLFADGSQRAVYMIFLVFECRAIEEIIRLNEEFNEYRWVAEDGMREYDLNPETLDTLDRLKAHKQ